MRSKHEELLEKLSESRRDDDTLWLLMGDSNNDVLWF